MSGPDDGPHGAEASDASASFPSAPPSFGHRSAEPTAPQAMQGPPNAPWWAPEAPYDDVLVAGPGFSAVDTRRAVPAPGVSDEAPVLEPDAIHPPGTAPTAANPLPQAPMDVRTPAEAPASDWAGTEPSDPWNAAAPAAAVSPWATAGASPETGGTWPVAEPAPATPQTETPQAPTSQAELSQAAAPQAEPAQAEAVSPWTAVWGADNGPATAEQPAIEAAAPWAAIAQAAAVDAPAEAPADRTLVEGVPAAADRTLAEGIPVQAEAPAANQTMLDGLAVQPANQTSLDGLAVQPAAAPAGQTMLDGVSVGSGQGTLDGVAMPVVLPWASSAAPAAAGPSVMELAAAQPAMMPSTHEPPPPPPAAPAFAPPPPGPARSGKTVKYALLALVPALVIGAGGFVLLNGSGDDKEPMTAAQPTPNVSVAPSTPAPEPSPTQSPEAAPSKKPSIGTAADNIQTDQKLTLARFFGGKRLRVSAHAFVQDARSLNKRCDYTAQGKMIKALKDGKCEGVARATYLTKDKRIGVTVGVVAMPSKTVAEQTRALANPTKRDWFIGLPGKHTKNIMDAGGFATTSSAGRYVLYAYVRYINGPGPTAKSYKELTKVAEGFLIYLNQPLKA